MERVQIVLGPQITDKQLDTIKYELDNLHFSRVTKNPDFYLVAGGDGTFLNSFHELGEIDTPIFGVNFGHLGFFMGTKMEELKEHLTLIKNDEYFFEQHHLLAAIIKDNNKNVFNRLALNDFVVKGCKPNGRVTFGATQFDVFVNDDYCETIFGDGFLISTSAGSTAYNRSLGGAMLQSSSGLFQLTELASVNSNAWRSFNRPIIFDNQTVTIKTSGNVIVGSDGKEVCLGMKEANFFLTGDIANILRPKGFNILSSKQKSFLNNKM